MAGTTTAMCSSFKTDLPTAVHCFGATVTATGTPTNAAFTLTSMSTLVGIFVGMACFGGSIPAGAVVASIDSTTQITMSKAATGSPGAETVTFTGDVFNMVLVKVSPTGTYGAATTKYADLTGNSDEVSGTGYTTGGQALTANQTPVLTSTTAFWQWSTNPSWTSSTFSTTGGIIVNTTQRGPVVKPAAAVYDFGGTQSVSVGTLTLIQPANTSAAALLRIA